MLGTFLNWEYLEAQLRLLSRLRSGNLKDPLTRLKSSLELKIRQILKSLSLRHSNLLKPVNAKDSDFRQIFT